MRLATLATFAPVSLVLLLTLVSLFGCQTVRTGSPAAGESAIPQVPAERPLGAAAVGPTQDPADADHRPTSLAHLQSLQELFRKGDASPAEAAAVVSNTLVLYHELFFNSRQTWFENHWLGIKCWQNPNDVWITQEILSEVKPDFVIETGSGMGASAMIWALVLSQVNPDARVITIDVEDRTADSREKPIWKMIDFYQGSSTDPKIVEEVRERVRGKKVVVLLDSDHSEKHVAEELRAYWDLVPVGSYLIVQDTNANGHPVLPEFGPGPMEAVLAFLEENDRFEVDKSRERLLFTMHPNGYLRRVK